MFSHCGWVGGSHVTTFTVPVSVGDVEAGVVVCVESMYGVQLGKPAENSGGIFELVECFTGFGVRRTSGGSART